MSTRFYPRYVRGNPQLRIFLPDWKMIMIKRKEPMPENTVSFKIDPRMTDWDVKNYLEKIYKVQVAGIKSRIYSGDIHRTIGGGVGKRRDYKIADVSLPIGQKFTWPDLFPKKKVEEEDNDLQKTREQLSDGRQKDPNVQDIPSWFM